VIQITKNIETEIIQEIITGYTSCKTFFLTHTNKDYEIHTRARKEFLITLCQSFYNKFKDHSEYFRVEDVQNYFQSNYYIPLNFGKNNFDFPHTFSVFMDQTQDINITPVSVSGLPTLDDYIKREQKNKTLVEFILEFLRRLDRVVIGLRKREIKVLETLTDKDFLFDDSKGNKRTAIPTNEEILQKLKFPKKGAKNIERAEILLRKTGIIAFQGLFNLNHIGYCYIFQDNPDNVINKDIFNKKNIKTPLIECIPLPDLKNHFEPPYTQMITNWYWNVNLHHYRAGEENPWKDFSIPNFLKTSSFPKKCVHWPLTYVNVYLTGDSDKKFWEFISTTKSNTLIIDNILDRNVHKSTILNNEFLSSNHMYLYPVINNIGLDFKVSIRFSTKKKNLFMNIVKSLLHFPIAHVFSNEEFGEGFSYIHVPRHTVSYLFEAFEDLKRELAFKSNIQVLI